MLKALTIATALAFTILATAQSAAAWDLIGIRTVGFGVDRDVVNVRGNDKHKKFRMCVQRAGIRVRDLDIRFANGGRQDVAVRNFFAPGSCTRVVDLKGNKRKIARVAVTYNRFISGRTPIVTFWAR